MIRLSLPLSPIFSSICVCLCWSANYLVICLKYTSKSYVCLSVCLSVCLYVSLYSYTLVVFSVGRFLPLRFSRLSLLIFLALHLVRSILPKRCCLAHLPFPSVAFGLFDSPLLHCFLAHNNSTVVLNETIPGASQLSVHGNLLSTACIQYQWSCKGMYCNRFTSQFLFSGWC